MHPDHRRHPKALVPVVDKAMKAGIVVVDFDNLVDTPTSPPTSTFDSEGVWKGAGRVAGESDEREGQHHRIQRHEGTANLRIDGSKRAKGVFRQYPQHQMSRKCTPTGIMQRRKGPWKTSLAAYPKIDGVWSQGGAMSEAVIEAVSGEDMNPPPAPARTATAS